MLNNNKMTNKKSILNGATKLKNNIIARGEVSGHSHIVVGEADAYEKNGEIILDVYGEATIKHLLEDSFCQTKTEVWTKEHTDIPLKKGLYKYVPQKEKDPYSDLIKSVKD